MKEHKWFSDFVSQGVVDFAIVDCENIPSVFLFPPSDLQIKLELSNVELTESTVANPLFVIANYVFSNLRNDVIRIENGSLQHGLLSLSCPDSADSANLIPRMQFTWSFTDLPDSVLQSYDPSLQQSIQLYRQAINVAIPFLSLSERHCAHPCRRHLALHGSASNLAIAVNHPFWRCGSVGLLLPCRDSETSSEWLRPVTPISVSTALSRCLRTSTRWIALWRVMQASCTNLPIWRDSL